jgi:hypothetical protein
MKVFTLDVDSGERDPSLYPNPNDYTIKLNRTLYGVSKLTIVGSRIPNYQNLINSGNKQFQLDDKTYVMREAMYTNGADLASNIQTTLIGSNVSQVTFNSQNNTLLFSNCGIGSNVFSFKFMSGSNGYATQSLVGPPANVLGFSGLDVGVSAGSNVLVSNVIDLDGPTSLFVRLTCRGDDFDRDIYVNGGTFSFGNNAQTSNISSIPPNYVGRIILRNIGEITQYTQNDHQIAYDVPDLNIDQLRIRFYWNNGNKLIPYDFGKRNHIIKFEIECQADRLDKKYEEGPVDELPPPVDPPPERFRRDTIFMVALGFILFIGMILLFTL